MLGFFLLLFAMIVLSMYTYAIILALMILLVELLSTIATQTLQVSVCFCIIFIDISLLFAFIPIKRAFAYMDYAVYYTVWIEPQSVAGCNSS